MMLRGAHNGSAIRQLRKSRDGYFQIQRGLANLGLLATRNAAHAASVRTRLPNTLNSLVCA